MTRSTPGRPRLSNADIVDLTSWRHELHRHPELSGEEHVTAERVQEMLRPTYPDRIVTGLGGHGVAAVYDSGVPGPRVLLRAELDALPIEETGTPPYLSLVPGKAHLCGHDGHMATLAGVARLLGRKRPERGSVVLMFQPAEEDGSGAARVVADPRFGELKPDYAFALHNAPGLPLGHVAIAEGAACCASRGMRVVLSGRTAHASQPETGLSPMRALGRLMPELTGLSHGAPGTDPDFTLATVCHARLGEPAFGVAPGRAELFVTLRTLTDARMSDLVDRAEAAVQRAAASDGLTVEIGYHDVFATTANDAKAVRIVTDALDELDLGHDAGLLPLRASEDFGRFGDGPHLAIFLLGAGEGRPALHNPDYDFPDELIEVGSRIFMAVLERVNEAEDRAP
ncbi:amidohydrolase [Salinihabitans flavidus]|uniref:Amidohydrolase n=1 Tax=Salinihabitans flavidus TaxID=569882 RepID=A0A1H8SJA7_9RHOB|nr:amidohydrolase [Salinihabitans flavidus]SEO78606.1 amidohydrolase [Salinihabitans flavidus]